MDIASTSNWYKINTHYLVTAVAGVHRELDRYVARQQQQPTETVPEDESALRAISSSMSSPPALEQLCITFNLSPFERRILLLCVGMAILPKLSSLCAQAQGNAQMTYPTFSLALEVFPQAHWSAFTLESPLRRWQLLQVETGQVITLCPLQVDESILHYLFGEPYHDRQLSNSIQPVEVNGNYPLQPSHQELAERLAATWLQRDKSSPLPIVQLCSTEVNDKWQIAIAACNLMGCSLKIMPVHRLPTDADELHRLLERWEREVILTSSTLLLDCDRLKL